MKPNKTRPRGADWHAPNCNLQAQHLGWPISNYLEYGCMSPQQSRRLKKISLVTTRYSSRQIIFWQTMISCIVEEKEEKKNQWKQEGENQNVELRLRKCCKLTKYWSKALFTGRLKEASITSRLENYLFGSCMTDKLFQMSGSFHTVCVPKAGWAQGKG